MAEATKFLTTDSDLRLWSMSSTVNSQIHSTTVSLLLTVPSHAADTIVTCARWNHNHQVIVSCATDGTIALTHHTGQLLGRFDLLAPVGAPATLDAAAYAAKLDAPDASLGGSESGGATRLLAFSAGSRYLCSAPSLGKNDTFTNSVDVWDLKHKSKIFSITTPTPAVTNAYLSNFNNTHTNNGSAGTASKTVHVTSNAITALAFGPTDATVITATEGGLIFVHAFAPSGSQSQSSGLGKGVLAVIPHPGTYNSGSAGSVDGVSVADLCLCPASSASVSGSGYSGATLAVAYSNGVVALFDLSQVVSKSGNVATISGSSTVLSTPLAIASLNNNSTASNTVTLSKLSWHPSGRFLVIALTRPATVSTPLDRASADLCLWDPSVPFSIAVPTRPSLLYLPTRSLSTPSELTVTALEVSPDGCSVILGYSDGACAAYSLLAVSGVTGSTEAKPYSGVKLLAKTAITEGDSKSECNAYGSKYPLGAITNIQAQHQQQGAAVAASATRVTLQSVAALFPMCQLSTRGAANGSDSTSAGSNAALTAAVSAFSNANSNLSNSSDFAPSAAAPSTSAIVASASAVSANSSASSSFAATGLGSRVSPFASLARTHSNTAALVTNASTVAAATGAPASTVATATGTTAPVLVSESLNLAIANAVTTALQNTLPSLLSTATATAAAAATASLTNGKVGTNVGTAQSVNAPGAVNNNSGGVELSGSVQHLLSQQQSAFTEQLDSLRLSLHTAVTNVHSDFLREAFASKTAAEHSDRQRQLQFEAMMAEVAALRKEVAALRGAQMQ